MDKGKTRWMVELIIFNIGVVLYNTEDCGGDRVQYCSQK